MKLKPIKVLLAVSTGSFLLGLIVLFGVVDVPYWTRAAHLVIALGLYCYVVGGYLYGVVADRLRYGHWYHLRLQQERSEWLPWRW